MKKRINLIILIIIAIIILVIIGYVYWQIQIEQKSFDWQKFAFVPKNTSEIDTSNWLTYRNEEYGFEFKYPKEWEVKESMNVKFSENSLVGDKVAFTSPNGYHFYYQALGEKKDEFIKYSIPIYIFDLDNKLDYSVLDVYEKLIHSGDGTVLEGRKIEDVNINGIDITKITLDDNSQIQYVFIRDNKYFEINLHYNNSYYYRTIYEIPFEEIPDEYNEKQILGIINTFKFIN